MLKRALYQMVPVLLLVGTVCAEEEVAAKTTGQGIMGFLPLIAIFVIFYFLLIRPQQKKAKEQKAMLGRVAKDDAVITNGGLYGTVTGVTDDYITLEIAQNVRVKIARSSISSRKPK